MSVEREIANVLDELLDCTRRAEQHIIYMDTTDKLKVVSKLVDLEESIKAIMNDITIPAIEITKDTTIEELQRENLLSARAGNILRRAMYKTVGDITKHTENELRIVRNMGRKSLEEILEFIRVNGFVLPDKAESEDI